MRVVDELLSTAQVACYTCAAVAMEPCTGNSYFMSAASTISMKQEAHCRMTLRECCSLDEEKERGCTHRARNRTQSPGTGYGNRTGPPLLFLGHSPAVSVCFCRKYLLTFVAKYQDWADNPGTTRERRAREQSTVSLATNHDPRAPSKRRPTAPREHETAACLAFILRLQEIANDIQASLLSWGCGSDAERRYVPRQASTLGPRTRMSSGRGLRRIGRQANAETAWERWARSGDGGGGLEGS